MENDKMARLITNKKVHILLKTTAITPSTRFFWWEFELIPTLALDHTDRGDTLPVGYSTEDPGALGTAWADG